jgi:hypothetical protein
MDPAPAHAPPPESRIYRRVPLELTGRYLNADGSDHPIVTADISCGGALVRAGTRPEKGANIVCYFDELGRVACKVVRVTHAGFAVAFKTTERKRDKLADGLTWLLNRDRLGLEDERRAPRYPAGGPALVVCADGTRLGCRVTDISLTGAAFTSEGPPPTIGEIVRAGSLRGEVVRVYDNRFAIRFEV